MEKVIGIRFRKGGKTYHFDPGEFSPKKDEYVIVNTEQGIGLGQVIEPPCPKSARIHPQEIKKIERLASEDELRQHLSNLEVETDAKSYCLERIAAHALPMNLVDVEYFFDGSKIIFYFTADGRVDFRELLKDLVRRLRTRVELRQIGIRNQAKMVGGLGGCGRPLCCASFLKNFHAVSIKMAKEQNLSLNPAKISGACGRLMCCLQYEHETYKELKKDMPKIGKKVEIPEGRGKVVRQNVMGRSYTIQLEDGREIDINLDQNSSCECKCPNGKNRNNQKHHCPQNGENAERRHPGNPERRHGDNSDRRHGDNPERKNQGHPERRRHENPERKHPEGSERKQQENSERNHPENPERRPKRH